MHTILERNKGHLENICRKYKVDLEEVIWRNRTKEFKKPRCEVACVLKYKYNYTYEMIWEAFDWRNHAAIVHLVKHCKPKKQFGWRLDYSQVN